MEVIIELLQIFRKEGLRSAGLIGNGKKKSLPEKFMLLVLEKQIWEDDLLAKKIYGSSKSDPKYRNLKKRVKRQLIDAIPRMDSSILGFTSEYNQAYYDCLEACNNLTLLSRVAAYDTSLNIIKSKYPIALKFQFYDILTKFSYYLIKINALRGDSKVAREEEIRFSRYLDESSKIQQAQVCYLETLVVTTKKSSYSKDFISEYRIRLKELEDLQGCSFEFLSWLFYTRTYYYVITNELGALQNHLKEFERVFKDWSNYNPGRLTALVIQKAYVHFQIKEYEVGLNFINKHLPSIKIKRNNWGLLKRIEFCLAINCNINHAQSTYAEFEQSAYFKLQNNKLVLEIWRIHNAYLQFMLQYTNHPDSQKFNLYKFINEVDIYSKDKPGYNFSIIAIELLFYLLWDDLDRYIDKMTALMAYRLRHLNTKTFQRSNVFAQLLLSIEQKKFDLKEISASGQQHYKYLGSLEDRLSINEWEIIGYDRLWEIALDLLKKRNKKIFTRKALAHQ